MRLSTPRDLFHRQNGSDSKPENASKGAASSKSLSRSWAKASSGVRAIVSLSRRIISRSATGGGLDQTSGDETKAIWNPHAHNSRALRNDNDIRAWGSCCVQVPTLERSNVTVLWTPLIQSRVAVGCATEKCLSPRNSPFELLLLVSPRVSRARYFSRSRAFRTRQ